ncbi:TRAP transporter small permease subunit [Aidingimonas halophila]|uniref:TRAP transporter small permease protein n=1 Tax=Aidingimonas halophila TaxID=574349 RepID=A0A1H3GTA1_9GAMM|nr:TRAP transporter small permease [Aidingimonas halophila]GHC35950.1 C4-dicarboxylate ABC transporter substrate-binding protein [Aidingimonas halophila]SDY06572.1 TRAP-type mannitol/chloroaromatic compound transport system, small permease component [Aidingimonas halophila]
MNTFSSKAALWLERLYRACGYLAALCIFVMLIVIVIQVVLRWSGMTFPGASNYAGYLMGTGTFLALAYTFHEGGHIRVSLLLDRLGRLRPLGELWCLLAAAGIVGFITWHAADAAYWSYQFGDVSSGQDAMPLWIPQSLLAFGAMTFTLSILDHFLRRLATMLRSKRANHHATHAARSH